MRFPLAGSSFRIGRHPSNDLTLPDEEISRFHLSLERREEGYWVVDQSRNGTYLNARRVTSSSLRDKDEMQVGRWRLVYTSDVNGGEKETVVQKKAQSLQSFCGIIGQSAPMLRVFSMIEKVAPTTMTVLIMGETGVGKELVARAIHDLSPRSRKPFVPLNCGAISPQLIESELFGHERGAFTGALSRHHGAFEQARGGTLVLDEIGELPLELQPKLLRVLEEKRFRRVGGTEEIEADIRIVAATHRNLESLAREGKFREDLYFRLFSVPISIPPLRERSSDILLLANSFLNSLQTGVAEESRRRFSTEAEKRLMEYLWRGNVRELKNVITRSLLFAKGNSLLGDEILFLSEGAHEVKPSLENIERNAIVSALKQNDWNKTRAAEALGIAKSTLFNKIKEYDIKGPGK